MEARGGGSRVLGVVGPRSLTSLVEELEETCRKCSPLSAITCVTGCRTWKLKNQFRQLHEKIGKPDFVMRLLNTVKNKRRLQLLETLVNENCSLGRLQQRLKEQGFSHSQQTMVDEYLKPLVEAGLADQAQDVYRATLFGSRLSELVRGFHDVLDGLPAHSECHEEDIIAVLLKSPRTYENMRGIIPTKSVSRVLGRLRRSELVKTNEAKDYVFFFTTRRDPLLSRLSPTEARVYFGIPADGIAARKLAEKIGISLRRTYKYVRKLKGKKLVFTREKPPLYTLTARGVQTATMLEAVRSLALEVVTTTTELVNHDEKVGALMPNNYPAPGR